MHLTRTFVETGDERCPIAGIWSRLETDAAADDSELAQAAMWSILPRRPCMLVRRKHWRVIFPNDFAVSIDCLASKAMRC
jgi:hypothetical protein